MMDKPTARERSAFGQFQLGTSHIKSNIPGLAPKPRATEMAALMREGHTLEELSEMFAISVRTVRTRLNESGFKSNGHPKIYKP